MPDILLVLSKWCMLMKHFLGKNMMPFLTRAIDQVQHFLFYRNTALFYLYAATALAHIFLWGILIANRHIIYQPSKEFITLHYKVGIGPDFVGPWYGILALPFLGLAILVGNCIIGRWVYHSERFSSYALAVGALYLQLILAWSLYLIVKANLY